MYKLDFLSASPKVFIFQKEKNKTDFGGILFLIYIIVMILISLIYIADYSLNEKISYETLTISTRKEARDRSFLKDIELNPILNISINFLEKDKFAVHEFASLRILEDLPIYDFSNKFSEMSFMIYYKCNKDPKCASFKEYIWNIEYPWIFGKINITYQGYKINHFHEPPVYEDDSGNYSKNLTIKDFSKYVYTERYLEWEVIRYKDQKSLFDFLTKRKTDFIFGNVKNLKYGKENETEYDDYAHEVVPAESDSKDGWYYYLPLYSFKFINPYDNYLLYKRTKISSLDVLAKIGALFSTIKFFFAFAFSFYSNNFNNYAMVNYLLNPPKKVIKSINYSGDSDISINDLDNDSPLIDEQSNENKENKNVSNINDNDNNNDNDINNKKKYSNEDNSDASSFVLKKLCFCDFLINNIYSKCCKRMRNQEILNMTNKIAYKYLSIDSLLINQMKIENLFKDYKWNNPLLNNV